MVRDIKLQLMIDKRHADLLGVVPSTYYLGRMYDNNSARFTIVSPDNSVDLDDCDIFLRFISGNVDIGKALVMPIIDVDENGLSDDNIEVISSYSYLIGMMYTKKSKLQVQVILDFSDGSEMRSNIVTFNLGNSLPEDKEFYQNLSYLDRLVCNKSIKLFVDEDDRELIILDDLETELCRIDIDSMLPKEWW